MKTSLPYIKAYKDRHGHLRHYFRRAGFPTIALPGVPGSPEFQTAYSAALAAVEVKPCGTRAAAISPARGSVASVLGAYYADASFRSLSSATQRERRIRLERFRQENGDKRLAAMEQRHVALMLGTKTPAEAKNWLSAIRGMMQFAVDAGMIERDPTAGLKTKPIKSDGFHTWTEHEIEAFEHHHAVQTRERLALALLLYTAARRGDAVTFGAQHVRAGRLYYRQQKTGRAMAVPIHPQLSTIIEATPSGHLTFLINAHGAPFTAAAFGLWFKRACVAAGLSHCSAHGLRKAAARRLAEAGCTVHEIAAITGHKTLGEVQRYTAAADQARLADVAMKRER